MPNDRSRVWTALPLAVMCALSCASETSPGTGDPIVNAPDGGNDSATRACEAGQTQPCYTGPEATKGIGLCRAGQRTCLPDESGFGTCAGEVVPVAENCRSIGDHDCDGVANEQGEGCVCTPGATEACYTGPEGTRHVGICADGQRQCNAQGSAWGECKNSVLPAAAEDCATAADDNCSGAANEGCVCTPGVESDCYTAASATRGVGLCHGGRWTCNPDGLSHTPCANEVTPVPETCNTPGDDDCNGQTNETGAGCACVPNTIASCYSGLAGTAGVGLCKAGTKTCNAEGTAYGPCFGEVLPTTETCNTPDDDDCDGQTNESGTGCVCAPNASASCYSGPAGTAGVGLCKAGTKTCNAQGTAYGACFGEVLPKSESCATGGDDDCNGLVNEGCP